jgi:threonine/homoserine/homoserine lactone efflux protein
MGEAIGQALPMAVGVALSPIPIIAVILMLVTRQARVNGPAFVIGWLIGLALIGIMVIGVAGGAGASSGGERARWVLVLELVLGLLLLLVAARQFQGRPTPGEEAAMPTWMDAIDAFTPGKALGAGALLSALNPKNLLLAVGGAATIAQTGIETSQQAIAYLVFALIATIGVAAPVVIFFALGDRAPAVLDRMKAWMGQNNAVIMAILCLIIGVKLIGQGLGGLTT